MNQIFKTRWVVDVVLFVAFLGCFFLDLTGTVLHQILGLIGAGIVLYHLLSHWKWVRAVTGRFFSGASSQTILYYVVDALLLLGFVAILTTGLVISTWLNLVLSDYVSWHTAHVLFSIGSLLMVVLKLTLHARWIATTARRMFAPPALAPTPVQIADYSRRDFLAVVGTVGAAALVAIGSSAPSLVKDLDSSTTEQVAITSGSNSVTSSTSTKGFSRLRNSNPSSSSCAVRCGKRCSYPGHCRRYTDSNDNGRCDLGECLS